MSSIRKKFASLSVVMPPIKMVLYFFNVSMETKQSGNNQPQKLQIRMLKLLLLFELRKPRDRPFNFDWLPSVISTSVSRALDFNITMKRWIIDEFWNIIINIKIKKRWARSIVRNYDELFFEASKKSYVKQSYWMFVFPVVITCFRSREIFYTDRYKNLMTA